jgi:predicted dehydrogenase
VGSRSVESAKSFASSRGVARAYGSYAELLRDDTVDAIYNSLPNNLHHEWTIRALEAGKHVLCEKPFAMNFEQAKEMFAAAKKHDRVLVEAFMYRSHPLTHAVLGAVRSGEIGQLRLIRTSFCYRTARMENIRFQKPLGGGGLMDIGCYCINFSRLIARCEPSKVHATAIIGPTGVDTVLVGTLTFPTGVLASFTCGMDLHANNTVTISGTEGYIEVPVPWKPPAQRAEYVLAHSTPPKMDTPPTAGKGPPPRESRFVDANLELYALEAMDFAATVFDGKPPAVSEADTLGNMAVIDEMRRQIAVEF